jgi:hypothetical protein
VGAIPRSREENDLGAKKCDHESVLKAKLQEEENEAHCPMKVPIPVLIFMALALSSDAAHKEAITIPAGSNVFVDSNNGFDTFILAAFQSKHLRVNLVSSVDKADYILDSSLFHTNEAMATKSYATTGRTSEAAFKLTSKSGDIIWAYAVTKGIFSRGKQSVAEACAKHLKDIIGK